MAGRLGDERGAVPVVLRVGAGRVEGVPGGGGEAAVPIDLAHLVGDRVEVVAVGDHRQGADCRPAADRFVIAIGDRHVDAGVAVGRRAEQSAFFAEADAPGVVVRVAEEFQLRAVAV